MVTKEDTSNAFLVALIWTIIAIIFCAGLLLLPTFIPDYVYILMSIGELISAAIVFIFLGKARRQ